MQKAMENTNLNSLFGKFCLARFILFLLLLCLSGSLPATGQTREDKDLELVVQTGHAMAVTSVVFSPDSKLIATASWDGNVNLWDADSGKKIRTLGGSRPLESIAFSPDGKMLVSGGRGRFEKIKLWDVETGKLLRVLTGHSHWIRSVAFSPDGRRIASGSWDKTVKLWDAATGQELKTLTGHSDVVMSVAFSPDGKILASCGLDKKVSLWDIETGKLLGNLTGHSEKVWSLAFSPDGKMLASASGNLQNKISDYGAIKVWDVTAGREISTFTGHSQAVTSVAFSSDGKHIVSGSFDKTVKLWDAKTGQEIRAMREHPERILSVAISPDDKRIVSGSGSMAGTGVKLWDADTGRELRSLAGNRADAVVHAVFGPDGKTIVNASFDKTIKFWNLEKSNRPVILRGHSDRVNSAELSFDGKLLVSSGGDETVKLWNVETGRVIKNFEHPKVQHAGFSPDGKIIASSSGHDSISLDRVRLWDMVKLWDVETGREIRTLKGHAGVVAGFSFSPDGTMLASASYDKTIKLWSVETGEEIRTLKGHKSFAFVPKFSPDGKLLVSSSYDKTIKLWDVATGKELKTLNGHTEAIIEVSFSPDGKTIASASYDKTIRLWDVASGKELKVLRGHKGAVFPANFSPDGKLILSGGLDRTIRLWDAKTGKELIKLIALDESEWVAISPDGRFDGSEVGLNSIHYSYGLEIIDLEQLKEGYYEPGLLQKLLGFSQESLRPIVPLEDIKLHPEVIAREFDADSKKLIFKLKSRGGGIGETRVLVNGKLAVPDARPDELIKNPYVSSGTVVTLTADLSGTSIKKGEENNIEIFTSNYLREIGKGNIQSRGVGVRFVDKSEKEFRLPSLYAVVGGVSDYEGDEIDLRFAAKDAEDFSHALKLGARRLFCPQENLNCLDKVRITTLSTSGNDGTIQPTKESFKRAFSEIAQKAMPDDIIVIYLAGHGVAFGDDTYFFLTREARSAGKEDLEKTFQTAAISSEELTDWLTQTEWVAGEKGIKALKQVLILDTCAAETAARQLNLIAKRDLSSDQIRAIEFLKDKTGTFILMGSAASAAAYEATQFGQGLLTRALLEGMKGAALDSDRVDVQTLFGYAEVQVPRLATSVGQVQRPRIAVPTGQTFPIGQMTEAEKRQIALPTKKPFFGPPVLSKPPTNTDPLRLTQQLISRLEEESSFEVVRRRDGRKETMLVYVDDAGFPDAIRVTGFYTTEGDTVKLQAYLTKNERVIKELPPIETEKTEVLDELLAIVRRELARLGVE